MSLGHLGEGAYHDANHIIQESVGADAEGDEVPFPRNRCVHDVANRGLHLGPRGHAGSEIPFSDKAFCGGLHGGKGLVGDGTGVVPGTVMLEGIAILGIQNAVDIFLGGHRIAGVEVCGHPEGLIGRHGIGQVDIEGAGELVQRDGSLHGVLPLGGDRGTEHIGVYPAVGTGAARDVTGIAEQSLGALVQGLLDGIAVLLGLVAAEMGAVVAYVKK